VAFLAALTAFGSRFAGKVLTTTLGWASTLLFGRVPASRQILLLGITFGSVIWMVMLVGLIVPDVGAFLLVLVPPQAVVPQGVIRLLMLIGVIVAPSIVGVLTLALSTDTQRSPRDVLIAVARGYPLTILLAVLLVFLAALAIWRKIVSLTRRWTDAHIPIVVDPGAYDQVASDLRRALADAGLDLAESQAPATMSKPAKWLATIAGRGSGGLVPDRMLQLRGDDLDILIYPMDILIAGTPPAVARARAAMASRLTTSAAHLTVSAEAQVLEDRLTVLAGADAGPDHRPRFDDAAATEFAAIDAQLATINIPYEEWEVLYRQRLQVERDLRAGAMAGEAVLGGAEPAGSGPGEAIATVGRILRQGTSAILDAVTDDSTIEALDRLAGPRWRLAAQAADVAVVVARGAVEGAASPEHESSQGEHQAGEPAAFPIETSVARGEMAIEDDSPQS
jgi:hypothetical protein